MGRGRFVASLVIATAVAAVLSLSYGFYEVPLRTTFRIISSRLWAIDPQWAPAQELVVLHLRLPRTLLVAFVGGGLGVSGAVLQAILKNPLASPYLLGISAGASVGASAVIALGVGHNLWALQAASFASGLIAVSGTYLIARAANGRTPVGLILAGVVVSAFCSAIVALLQLFAETDRLQAIVFWLMGGFSRARWADVIQVVPVVGFGSMLCWGLAWRINALSLGDIEARALGIDTARLRGLLIVTVSLMTSAAVTVCGPIGWVGLIAPHLVRIAVGANNAWVICGSAWCGATLLLLSDVIARSATSIEIPIGIVTALLGGPFFAYVLRIGSRTPWPA